MKLLNLTVRIPESLHAALVTKAHQEQRSLNGQTVFLLAHALGVGLSGVSRPRRSRSASRAPQAQPRPGANPPGSEA